MLQTNSLYTKIESLLKKIPELITEENELRYNKIKEMAENGDAILLEPLLKDEKIKAAFFSPILDSFVFKTKEFKEFLDYSSSKNNYSQYLGKQIGLYMGDQSLMDNQDVVLNFPYKDCVLEGGQKKEDGLDTYFEYDEKKQDYVEKKDKRREVFFNEILAKDEIDSLFKPKALCNVKRYNKKGAKACVDFTRDAEINKQRGLSEDTITDNLIIKGNNLLALHSLKSEFAGKVKLIYIDPPYNTGSDDFKYNDNFNHSTWLTFMKNRLEVARELLREDGCIFVQCDDNEQAYLKVLMDKIFDFVQMVEIKMNEGAANEFQNPFMPKNCEYGLYYTKNYSMRKYKPIWVEREYDKAYNKIVINKDDEKDFRKWEVKTIKQYIKEQNIDEKEITNFVIENANKIFRGISPKGAGSGLQEAMDRSAQNDSWDIYERAELENIYTYRGEMVRFYEKNIGTNANGKKIIIKELGSLWSDIKTTGIAPEGGVKLKNGKKPEALISRIIEMSTDLNDIILDYHLGSGTTAAVAHKMNRQYGLNPVNVTVQKILNPIIGDAFLQGVFMTPSPATKVAAISDYLAGKGGYRRIADEYGISPHTLRRWVESPEKALNHSSQRGIIELESSKKSDYTGLIERNELESEEPKFKTKDAEIRYLKDKIAYLETLTELMGYNPKEVPKKKDSNVFSIFSDQDDVLMSPDSVQSPESQKNVTTNIL